MNESYPLRERLVPVSIVVAGLLISGAVLLKEPRAPDRETPKARESAAHHASFEPAALPLVWGDMGQKLLSVGALDRGKFLSLYAGTERERARRLIDEFQSEPLVLTSENANTAQNLLWAVGFGNKSRILEKGEMADPRFGGSERFASTAGFTIAKGNPMEHYSRHPFVVLIPEEEALVEEVSKHIYRPCCDNSAHFPDCNHGMAMLGLLEMLASEGADEAALYEGAVAANRLWFPEQYKVIDAHRAKVAARGEALTPKELVGARFASASGFARLMSESETESAPRGGGSCSV